MGAGGGCLGAKGGVFKGLDENYWGQLSSGLHGGKWGLYDGSWRLYEN